MTSKPVSALLSDLAILQSHSRPKVSNDYPYSEEQFKTLGVPRNVRVAAGCPRVLPLFFTFYNHEHRHSGIGLHTPYSVHIGTAPAIQDKRQAVLNAAYAANHGASAAAPGRPKCPARRGSTSRPPNQT